MKKLTLASLVLLLGGSPAAFASFHLWQIDELYSDSTGTVQFIELTTTSTGQNFVSGQTVSSAGHNFTFGSNLVGNTAGNFLLLATPGYVALGGVPAADYNLGVNNFFNVAGDTINFANVNTLTFTGGQLPLDGTDSLDRAFNSPTFTTAVNSPHDFTGHAGSIAIPEPSLAAMFAAAAAGLAVAWKSRKRA